MEPFIPNMDAEQDLEPDVVSQLVAYDESRGASGSSAHSVPSEMRTSDAYQPVFDCVDMLHRVWSKNQPQRVGGADLPPQLGDLRIIRELGRGGMGVVYEAEQGSTGRHVAVKVLPAASLLDDTCLQRFRNEIRAAAALHHPHIVGVYSVGEDRGFHYYSMQLVRGPSLAKLLTELTAALGDTPTATAAPAAATEWPSAINAFYRSYPTIGYFRTVARLAMEACQALQQAHDVGILHRDIKPGNLLLDEHCQLLITDFGLAHIDGTDLTMTGSVVGTLRYMPPEQALAKRLVLDQRADIYSLGTTLYELLAIQPAFATDDRSRLLSEIAFHEPTPLRRIDSRIPVDLATIVAKSMAKDRDDRYPTAAAMGADLQAFLEDRPITAQPATVWDRLHSWSRRHQALVRLACAALAVLTLVFAVSCVLIKRAQLQAASALADTCDLLYTAAVTLGYEACDRGWPDEAATILKRYDSSAFADRARPIELQLLEQKVQQPERTVVAASGVRVNEFALFPDHRQLASVSDDGTLQIWNLEQHRLVHNFKLSDSGLSSVAVSPDGRHVAAANDILYLYDVGSADAPKKIFDAGYSIESLTFDTASRRLAAGVRYDAIVLLTLDGSLINKVASRARSTSLEFSPDGSTLIAMDREGRAKQEPTGIVKLWSADLSAERLLLRLGRPHAIGNLTIARMSPDGRHVAAGEFYQATATIFDSESGETLATTPPSRDGLTDLAFAPDSKTLAIGYLNGQVECYDLAEEPRSGPTIGRTPLTFIAHAGEVTSLKFIDSQSLATAGADGKICLWKLPVSAEHGFDLVTQSIQQVRLSPDGRRMLCICSDGYTLADPQTGNIIVRSKQRQAGYSSAAWSQDGVWLAVCASSPPSVQLLDHEGTLQRQIALPEPAEDAALSRDGTFVATIGKTTLNVIASSTGNTAYRQSLPRRGRSVTFSHDGRQLAFGGELNEICILDVPTYRPVCSLECSAFLKCLTYSPDDASLAAGFTDSIIRVWNIRKQTLQMELRGHGRGVRNMDYSADGRIIVSSSDDGTVCVWSPLQQRCFGVFYRRLESGTNLLMSLSSDAHTLAIGHQSGSPGAPDVYVWKLP